MNHNWKAIDVGMYDTLHKCSYCQKKFITQADNPEISSLPIEHCPSLSFKAHSIYIGNLVSGTVDKSIVQGYATFISLRGVNIKMCSYGELVKNYFNLKECKGKTVFIKHHNILSVYTVKLD